MGLPSRIANQKYGTRTSAVAQVDNEEKSPSWFGNPCLRPPELIAQHFAGLHKAQPLQNSNITCGPGSEEADLGGIGEVSGDVVAALRLSTRVPKVVITHSGCTSLRCAIAARAASSLSNELRRRSRACARLFCSRSTRPDSKAATKP